MMRAMLVGVTMIAVSIGSVACNQPGAPNDAREVQRNGLALDSNFSYGTLTIGHLRKKIALKYRGDPYANPCFGHGESHGTIISGPAAWALISEAYPLSISGPYQELLASNGSFAVALNNGQVSEVEYVVVPHPDTNTLDGPSTNIGLTWFRVGPIGDGTDPSDPCPRQDTGNYGFSCGKCTLDMSSCAPSDCTYCDSDDDLDMTWAEKLCPTTDPFNDSNSVYNLNFDQPL